MRMVLDSNVAVKWELTEADSQKAIKLRDDARAGLHDLLSPDVLPVEVGHAITRAERQGRVSKADGFKLWLGIMADCPPLHSHLPLMPRAYAISSATSQGIYDCLYIALAEHEGCELVTADSKLVKNLKSQFPFIVELSTL